VSGDFQWGDAPDHPILPRSFEYRIVSLHLELEPQNGGEPYLDLTLERGPERRTLRFWSPQELAIERGGPAFTGGFVIQDISDRGFELLGVRVADFEASHGAIEFLARQVEERS